MGLLRYGTIKMELILIGLGFLALVLVIVLIEVLRIVSKHR